MMVERDRQWDRQTDVRGQTQTLEEQTLEEQTLEEQTDIRWVDGHLMGRRTARETERLVELEVDDWVKHILVQHVLGPC